MLVSNGTLALQIAYKALELSGEVITTPFSFVATTSSLKWENLKPVFSDIDSKTLNIDPALIKDKINKHTSAILAVHVYGNPCNHDQLSNIAKAHNLKLIYDAAHCFSVKSKNSSIYNLGDVSTTSFHSTKLFHSIEGGAIFTQDDELYRKMKKMINFGYNENGQIDLVGINAKMNEFQAAMGLCILDDVDLILERRKSVYDRYNKALANYVNQPIFNEDYSQNYIYYPIILESEAQLNEIRDKLLEYNINPRRYFYPSLNTLDYNCEKSSCPVSESISERVLCLPIYDSLAEDEQMKIINIIQKLF